ncbi:PIN domain-containing protein [Acidithiobacillus ferriphilus]|uniref:TA system VapC family ribonuclease toxin n=1 Tax=Acidithiobacillus ferriphilus TaxID=1689834 RepID=UPI001C0794FD|nr:TA system VapC family ribonuclease toxin [Acidithiobacillus ferriphilus]MBU2847585.1 PIN domain-containing protein [Acidithiobacillus ferriphilus]
MIFLLDVNVLIALIDPMHVQHDMAHEWFAAHGQPAWATCPLTENAVLRIVGHPRYPNSPGTPAAVAPLIQGLRASSGHVFWPDDISLLDVDHIDASRLLTSGQITDSYLLALACAHEGQLATFDHRLVTNAVRNGLQCINKIR